MSFSSPSAAQQQSLAELKKEYVRPSSIPFPEDNPYTVEKAELGKTLFFDPRLSGNNFITCAMCHNPSLAWGDGLATGFGEGMKRLGRKTPTILNLAWDEQLMWDGRFDSLEEQALGPVGAAVEMNQPLDELVPELKAVPGYVSFFNIVFPDSGLTLENVAKAIATYERTIVSSIAPFDRWIGGDETAISEQAKNGFKLFNGKANCARCHTGWNFTDGSFHDIGLPIKYDRKHVHGDFKVHIHKEDKGRGDHFKNTASMQYAFKTPGLRNLSQRAPYMHQGLISNLKEMMLHYNTGGVQRPSLSSEMKKLNLTDKEMDDVVVFLKTLESNDAPVTLPILPH